MASSPACTGVIGYGNGHGAGVAGFGTGSGSYGVFSSGLLGLDDFILSENNNRVAGQCTLPAGQTSVTCTFGSGYANNFATPIVTVTPRSNPGAFFWISTTTHTDFLLNVTAAPASQVIFNYILIGRRT